MLVDMTKREKPVEYVPLAYPYGSVTDGEWVCGRCGDSLTGCALCAGEVIHIVPYDRFGILNGR